MSSSLISQDFFYHPSDCRPHSTGHKRGLISHSQYTAALLCRLSLSFDLKMFAIENVVWLLAAEMINKLHRRHNVSETICQKTVNCFSWNKWKCQAPIWKIRCFFVSGILLEISLLFCLSTSQKYNWIPVPVQSYCLTWTFLKRNEHLWF